jgi:LmbE family N-acetylglucosaminyl deacetylase
MSFGDGHVSRRRSRVALRIALDDASAVRGVASVGDDFSISRRSRATGTLRRLYGVAVTAVLLLIASALPASADSHSLIFRTCPRGVTMNIVAHEDDDLLFLSPDLLHDIQSGKCVRTVFLTAGDAAERVGGTTDQMRKYWMDREAGSRAAYALMARVRNSWRQSTVRVDGHPITEFTLRGAPRISEVFMRLPDGNFDGSGFSVHSFESLLKLQENQITAIHAIDGSTSYSKAGLLKTVTDLVRMFRPGTIRTQDYVDADYAPIGDHADHNAAAYLAHAASDAYSAPHKLIGYRDYDISLRPANVTGRDLTLKQNAFYLYDKYDSLLPCYTAALRALPANASLCAGYAAWLARSYQATIGQGWYQQCLVPDVSSVSAAFGGLPPSEGSAEAAIRGAGCSVGTVTEEPDAAIDSGYVLEQSPNPSPAFLPQGTKVNLVVSSGPPPEG